ncbi:MAG: hypothetical protein LBL08_02640 [Candidatus Nomurabacteria bacterium]|jgi:dUTPase|nr:hypothetical protein [Candidatus Nomurabacteria bacterium]
MEELSLSAVEVKVVNRSSKPLPKVSVMNPSELDVSAHMWDGRPVVVPNGGGSDVLHTLLAVEVPEGYEIIVLPHRRLELVSLVTAFGKPRVINSGCLTEILVEVTNNGKKDFVIHDGDEIATLKLRRKIIWTELIPPDSTLYNEKYGGGK